MGFCHKFYNSCDRAAQTLRFDFINKTFQCWNQHWKNNDFLNYITVKSKIYCRGKAANLKNNTYNANTYYICNNSLSMNSKEFVLR